MAFSPALADRVRHALHAEHGIVEKRMFGGLAFLRHGNLLVGAWESSLLVRLGPEAGAEALKAPHVEPFVNAGRTMKGWVVIGLAGFEDDRRLADWLRQARDFVDALPPK